MMDERPKQGSGTTTGDATAATVAPGEGGPLRQMLGTLRGWSSRRRLAAVIALLPMFAVYTSLGPILEIWWALPAALVCAGLASLIVASYVPEPRSGRLIDVGCTPCSVMAVGSILGALVLRDTRPLDAGMSAMAVLLLAFGFAQRLTQADTCALLR